MAFEAIEVVVEPWPSYGDSGQGPVWNVAVSCRLFKGQVFFSARLGRLSKGHSSLRTNNRLRWAIEQRIKAVLGTPCDAAPPSLSGGLREDRQRLAKDKRFAAWVAGMPEGKA